MLFFFQAEDGIRDLVRSRGLGDVYKRQIFPNLSVRENLVMAARAGVDGRREWNFDRVIDTLSLIHI